MLSLAHKLGRLELLSRLARSDAMQNYATLLHPGDWGHSNLHGVAERIPLVAHSYVARAFVAGLRCVYCAAASELDETAGEVPEGESETAGWSFAVFDLQRVSYTC